MKDKSDLHQALLRLPKSIVFLSATYALLFLWGIVVNLLNLPADHDLRIWFADLYWVLPFGGAMYGFSSSRKWGGHTSALGKSILLFSAGMLLQALGQIFYSIYAHVFFVEAPYPSIGDIGFFGSIPLYVGGLWYLGKVLNLSKSLKLTKNFLLVVGVVALLLSFSYFVFLKDYDITEISLLQSVLDFGYPLGQSLYVGMASLVYMLSFGMLGGKLRSRVLLLLSALFTQYLADFTFLFRLSRDMFVVGGISDMLYLTAYFLMGVSLVLFNPRGEALK